MAELADVEDLNSSEAKSRESSNLSSVIALGSSQVGQGSGL